MADAKLTALTAVATPTSTDLVYVAQGGVSKKETTAQVVVGGGAAVLAGQAGGQALYGGTAASENLDLSSTAHATKGYIRLDGKNCGIAATADNRFYIWTDGHKSLKTGTNHDWIIRNFAQFQWTDATDIDGTVDLGLDRVASRIFRPTNGGSTKGWMADVAGRAALANDYTNATATLASVTGLTINLEAARKYIFRAVLFCSESVAAEGIKIDFNGGSATATDFRAHIKIHDTTLLLSSQVTSLAGTASVATMTGASEIEINGEFVVNAAGTFIIRAAQNSHVTGTVTINKGSHIEVEDSLFF